MTCDGFALEWPEAMIDLELDLLRHPEKEGTPTPVDKWLAFRENLRKKQRSGKTLFVQHAQSQLEKRLLPNQW